MKRGTQAVLVLFLLAAGLSCNKAKPASSEAPNVRTPLAGMWKLDPTRSNKKPAIAAAGDDYLQIQEGPTNRLEIIQLGSEKPGGTVFPFPDGQQYLLDGREQVVRPTEDTTGHISAVRTSTGVTITAHAEFRGLAAEALKMKERTDVTKYEVSPDGSLLTITDNNGGVMVYVRQ